MAFSLPTLRPYFSQGLPTSGSMAEGMEMARPESTSSDSQENFMLQEVEVNQKIFL